MKRSVWVTFGLLCLLSSSSWIGEPAGTISPLPLLQSEAIKFATAGLIVLLFTLSRKNKHPESTRKPGAKALIAGLGLFGLPAIAIQLSDGYIPTLGRTALFAMVPIVVAIAAAAGETTTEERGARQALIPALIGVAGLLLLFPLGFAGTARGWALLAVVVVAVILAGVSSIRLFHTLQGVDLWPATTLISLSNAIVLLIASILLGGNDWTRSSLASLLSISSFLRLIEIPLLLWLAREMPPIRFAARYLIIPLMIILEGYALVRPPLTLRTTSGLLLLTAGAALLLLLKPAGDDEVLSLR